MCFTALEGERGGGNSRKRERADEAGASLAGASGSRRMVMAAGGHEVHHKHRRSLSDMNLPSTLLSPRATPGSPMDVESALGVYQKGVVKAGGVGGFPSPTKSMAAGLVLNVANGGGGCDAKGSIDGGGESIVGRNGERAGASSVGNAACVFANGVGGGKTAPSVRNGRAPLRSLLIVRPSSMAKLEVASPRTRMWIEGNNVDRQVGGGGYRIPLSPLALRREASCLARGVVGVRAGVQLDLATLARNCDVGCGELSELKMRRDKMAFFEKQCSRVTDHIYVGSDFVARNRETLRAAGITHVLNCVGFVCTEYFPGDLKYKTLWLEDTPGEDILSILYDVFDFLEEVREIGGRVFVHCCQGVSRSTALVIAYLMWKEGRSYDDVFRDVKTARGVTNPNMGFACQLLQWQKRVLGGVGVGVGVGRAIGGGGGGGGGGSPRFFRIAPHSHYDPLHLVHKLVPKAGVESLDTRGAFLLADPTGGLFVWKGTECPGVIAMAGEKAAKQMMKYEKLGGPVRFVNEGEEMAEFWAAFRNASSSPSSLSASPRVGVGIGSRLLRVPAYDADYDAVAEALSHLGSEQVVAAEAPAAQTGGTGVRRRGWNDVSVYIAQVEFCNGEGLTPSRSYGKNNDWVGKRGGSSESVDRGGGMAIETETSAVAVVSSSCEAAGVMEGGKGNGSCCSSPGTSGRGGIGRGKRSERRGEEDRENSCKALRRGLDGGPESPTMSQRRRFEESSTTTVDSERRGVGSGGVQEDDRRAREMADKNPVEGGTAMVETASTRQVGVEECVSTARLKKVGGEQREEMGGEEDKAASPSARSKAVRRGGAGGGIGREEDKVASNLNNGALSRLFEWPSRDEVHGFGADVLQSHKVFVLWILRPRGEEAAEGRSELVVWVGGECSSKASDVEDSQEVEEEEERKHGRLAWERRWWRAGDEFRLWKSVPEGTCIQVVEEGKEPDDFWAYFSQ
ncbi:hypothetical protein CBR_g8330 [Chara braunii]|uniref:Protein-serine/threonine phosphatase n=1 Tax=Chara braunii TaxID=69332 RepID=A0A388KLW2_CHABU|nr:hypothetical protein CBR_g8330 [Chara braunii]|eukprot:GBG71031.1 hypothetical protein CBR_g8330 [Chara braunii]